MLLKKCKVVVLDEEREKMVSSLYLRNKLSIHKSPSMTTRVFAILTLITCGQLCSVSGARDPPMVHIPDQGMIMGAHLKMFRTQVIAAFLGIPYAQPPTGIRRFTPPVIDVPRWEGIRNTTLLPPECLQNPLQPLRKHEEAFAALISRSYGQTTGSPEEPPEARRFDEDCLFLNIYLPDGTCWYSSGLYFFIRLRLWVTRESHRPVHLNGRQPDTRSSAMRSPLSATDVSLMEVAVAPEYAREVQAG